MEIQDYIDVNELSERIDGDFDLFKELATIFIKDSLSLLTSIDEAIKDNNPEKVTKSAHTLKGAVANFSAHKAYDVAHDLEKIGKSNNLKKAGKTYEKLKTVIEETKKAMKEIIAQNEI